MCAKHWLLRWLATIWSRKQRHYINSMGQVKGLSKVDACYHAFISLVLNTLYIWSTPVWATSQSKYFPPVFLEYTLWSKTQHCWRPLWLSYQIKEHWHNLSLMYGHVNSVNSARVLRWIVKRKIADGLCVCGTGYWVRFVGLRRRLPKQERSNRAGILRRCAYRARQGDTWSVLTPAASKWNLEIERLDIWNLNAWRVVHFQIIAVQHCMTLI